MMDRRVQAFYCKEHVIDQGKRLLAAGVAQHCNVPATAVAVRFVVSPHDAVEVDCMVDPEQLAAGQVVPEATDLRALCDIVAAKTEASLRGLGARWSAHGR